MTTKNAVHLSLTELRSLRQRATELLSTPPVAGVYRPEIRGDRYAAFALPLQLCQPQNRTRKMPTWRYGKIRKDLFGLMAVQAIEQGITHEGPLSGRPQVRCTRFSTRATDAYADWGKQAVDILCPSKLRRSNGDGIVKEVMGLGIIVGDAVGQIEQLQWCEPVKRGEGFVYIEVRRGESV